MKVSSFCVCFVVQVTLAVWCARASENVTDGPADHPTTAQEGPSAVAAVRKLLRTVMNSASASNAVRMMLQAEVSAECSLGILKLMRGLRNLEPWALRRKSFICLYVKPKM